MNTLVTTFTSFYEGWFNRHQHLQQQLTTTTDDNTLFWVTEFPPSLVFRFIKDLNLTPDQETKVESLKGDTARKEAEIGHGHGAREFSSCAFVYGLVNRAERLVDGEVTQLDDAMEQVKEAMRAVVVEADGLRVNVAKQMVEVLDVVQRVKLFAAVGHFRIRIRQ
nr:hypothetical protein [Tanacetum cinerariifolium]